MVSELERLREEADFLKGQIKALMAIVERLTVRPATTQAATPLPPAKAAPLEVVGHRGLNRLTLKQHATLLLRVAGKEWDEVSRLMKVDATTAKLHLRAAMEHFGFVGSQAEFMQSVRPEVDAISDDAYAQLYGLPKRWWEEADPSTYQRITEKRRTTIPPPKKKRVAKKARK